MLINIPCFILSLMLIGPPAENAPDDKVVSKDCLWQGKKLYGKIKFVENFPDLKIKFVENFPDLKVKIVQNFPDDCGEWQIVQDFPDLKVQVVENFPDVKVKIVENFPGLP
jgi:hypothetical protein